MIFNVTSGGGGTGLNLKVVGGTTQPENPRENTIWINTDTAITGYVLSPTQPESVAEGVVWLKTADEGVEINVGKKNAVLLHLADGKLYTGGTWANVEGWAYAGGNWQQFAFERLYLFRAGVDNTELTGGWTSDGYTDNGTKNYYGTVKIADDYIEFVSKSPGYRGGGTAKKVDLQGFRKITAICSSSNTDGTSDFGISNIKDANRNKSVATIDGGPNFTKKMLSINLDNAQGSYYVTFRRIAKVYEVYAE